MSEATAADDTLAAATTPICPICWAPHDPKRWVKPIPCGDKNGHVFCASCFADWTRLHHTCPACTLPLGRVLYSNGCVETYVAGVPSVNEVIDFVRGVVVLVTFLLLCLLMMVVVGIIGSYVGYLPPPSAAPLDYPIINCTTLVGIDRVPFESNESNVCFYLSRDLEYTPGDGDSDVAILIRGRNVAIAFADHKLSLGNDAYGIVLSGEHYATNWPSPSASITNAHIVGMDGSLTRAFHLGSSSRMVVYNATIENVWRGFEARYDSHLVVHQILSRWEMTVHNAGHFFAGIDSSVEAQFHSSTLEYTMPREPVDNRTLTSEQQRFFTAWLELFPEEESVH